MTSQRAGAFLVIPLCAFCHRGPKGLHGDRSMMKIMKVNEDDMLNMTIGMVFRRCTWR